MTLHDTFTRRQFFGAAGMGGMAGLGFGLRPGSARGARPVSTSLKPIRSCILIFYYGGPSHLDTWDPKPHAPAEVRGEYGIIGTSLPGVQVCEHLPRMAGLMHKVALVRSMHHPMRNHNSAAAEALTGRTPAGGDQELLTDDPRGLPTFGSAVSYALGTRANILPYVALPYTLYNVVQLPGQTSGLLGGAYDRFQVEGDPSNPEFRISAFDATADLSGRANLLRGLDRTPLPGRASRVEIFRERALRLIASPEVRRLFDLDKEPMRLRERYGKHRLGQSLLLAQRLAGGSVNFVAACDRHSNG